MVSFMSGLGLNAEDVKQQIDLFCKVQSKYKDEIDFSDEIMLYPDSSNMLLVNWARILFNKFVDANIKR